MYQVDTNTDENPVCMLHTSDQGFEVVWFDLPCSCSIIHCRAHVTCVKLSKKPRHCFYMENK